MTNAGIYALCVFYFCIGELAIKSEIALNE